MRLLLAFALTLALTTPVWAQDPTPEPTPEVTPEPEPTPVATPEATPVATPVATPAPAPVRATPKGPPGLELPLGLALHGRFDVAAERLRYTDNPMDGVAALRNYHHLLFVTRRATSDPFGLSIELLDLTFYEASWRFRPAEGPWRVTARAGKIIVPFGGEPPFHNVYGGRSGFDQQVVPVIWARHGVAGQFQYRWRKLFLTDDLFVVAGHRLRNADDVVNLQNDFSSADDTRIAVGNRVGAGWGPFTLWYSTYYNEVGFGRLLFAQALDATVWKIHGVPVLEDFTLRAGVLRYDVSGGGPGLDYYGFADYLELRYYPLDWLYVQARTGIRTTNNRRGVIFDETRLDELDGESHSLGVVARYRGISAGLYHYWNLEERNEQDDDFLRLMVTYAF